MFRTSYMNMKKFSYGITIIVIRIESKHAENHFHMKRAITNPAIGISMATTPQDAAGTAPSEDPSASATGVVTEVIISVVIISAPSSPTTGVVSATTAT